MFVKFAKPYANKIANYIKSRYPSVPVVYFAKGGSGYLSQQIDMNVDGLSIDWKISMASARAITGNKKVLNILTWSLACTFDHSSFRMPL